MFNLKIMAKMHPNRAIRCHQILLALFASLILMVTCGCHSTAHINADITIKPGKIPALSHTQAQQRSQQVSNSRYDLYLDLTDPSGLEYSGRVSIHFDLKQPEKPLRIDFQQGKVHRLLVNRETQSPSYNDQFLVIPAKTLKAGENIVEIEFTHPYSDRATEHNGLTRFKDNNDGRLYLFSGSSIPYSTSQILPLFDQPDLKATYKLTVKAPPEWEVATASQRKHAVNGNTHRWWYFTETLPIAPGHFSLQAGPFVSWEHEQAPIRLMVRKSMAEALSPEFWLSTAFKSKALNKKLLEQSYPFTKYDQILVPGLGTALRPQAGMGLFDEQKFLSSAHQSTPILQQAILENLTQSWLSASIKSPWWDEAWIQDSLARYLSYIMSNDLIGRDNTQLLFYQQVKQPTYNHDLGAQTRPVRHKLADTSQWQADTEAFRVNKGAALWSQLHQQLGDDAFRQGVQRYIHSRGNGPDASLFQALENTSGSSLQQWQKHWLDTTGVPLIKTEYQCKNNHLHQLQVQQIGVDKRPQSIGIGLFQLRNKTLQRYRTLPLTLTGKSTKVKIPGKQPCPDYIQPGIDGNGYLLALSEESFGKTLLDSHFTTPLESAMGWQALDSLLPVKQRLNLLCQRLPDEQNPLLSQKMLQELSRLYNHLQRGKLTVPGSRHRISQYLLDIEDFAWHQLNIAEPDSATQSQWFDFFIATVTSDDGMQQLKDMLELRREIKGLEFTSVRRWQMLVRLNSLDTLGAWGRAKREFQQHFTQATLHSSQHSSGQSYFQQAHASRPDTLIKIQWLNQLGQLEPTQALAISQVLFPPDQYQLVPALRQDIMTALASRPGWQAAELGEVMLNECSSHGILFLEKQAKLEANRHLQSMLQRKAAEARQCLQQVTDITRK